MKQEPGQSCQAEACALQTCLSAHTYSPERCDAHLKQLYQCCSKLYQDRAENNGTEHVKGSNQESISTACPMPGVVERWLKNHP
ncbi:uncharacterized protein BJ212DRAFT_1414850 [Suillus subaureus]|uniref:Cx9C motif-containing protein 4, mitochondrial n=1 Tax=Suillus subaureus TaxID=48587 RepID=A0A9P7APJ8_9AGAM|nr:uncharacterized protein BJ212DRAFT_1414850 [Suillus subaureus]KAG1793738.1 hypothetical protein BJ212DRAFT_1414850 [Suillus subaureus]